jgi:KDO2-lipid IV(A) lauroyltransferase
MAEAAAVSASRRPGARAWRTRRQMLARHLARALGPEAPPAGSRRMGHLVDGAIASYARYWAESLRIPGIDAAQLTAGISYQGYEHIAAGRAAGRGTILALPHLGGWEWAGTQLAAIGHPVSVVVERLEPPDLFDWFTEFRERLGMHVIPAGPSAASRCVAALAGNHLLCLLSDRLIEGTTGVEVEFFGERTALPAGPAILALRTGAALLPAAVYFEHRTDSHTGVVLPPLDTARLDTVRRGHTGGSVDTGGRVDAGRRGDTGRRVDAGRRGGLRAEVTRVTQDLAGAFETLIRRAPTQWHLMQPNWPSDAHAQYSGRTSHDGSKLH